MKNLAELYFLAALAVAPSLATDVGLYPLFNRHFQPMGDPKPGSEAFGLGKRQARCPANYFLCPNTTKCCPTGSTCAGGGLLLDCYRCEDGQHVCTDSVGFCCPNGTECIPGTVKCQKPCAAGSTPCYDSCCDPGYSCIGQNLPCLKTVGSISISITTPVSTTSRATTSSTTLVNSPTTVPTTSKAPTSSTTLVNSPTTIPTTPKTATSGTTLVNPSTTITIISTPTIADSEPTSPSTTKGENSLNGKATVEGSPTSSSPSSSPSSSTTAPRNDSNALKLGGWLGGSEIVFFFAFFLI